VITVNYNGRFGNNLFQYFLAKIISMEKNLNLFPYGGKYSNVLDIDGLFGDVITHPIVTIDDSFQSLEEILKFENARYYLDGYFQRSKFYIPYREHIKTWITFKNPIDFKPSEDSIILHIRRSDFGWNINSGFIPLTYYTNILDNIKFDKVYIVGGCSHNNEQNDIDGEVIKTFEKYKPIYPNRSAIEDFQMISKFKRVIESNSTFCWWATFISDNAEVIYSPKTKTGGYRDTDKLDVPNDNRYTYILTESEKW
jgi:hypothetical protein